MENNIIGDLAGLKKHIIFADKSGGLRNRVISSACLAFSSSSSMQVSLVVAPPPALTWRSAQNVAATLQTLIGPHSHTASQEGK